MIGPGGDSDVEWRHCPSLVASDADGGLVVILHIGGGSKAWGTAREVEIVLLS